MKRSFPLVLLTLLALAASVSSDSPKKRVTLKLENVTLAEAAAAVSKASGTPVTTGTETSPLPGPSDRASFAWENASLDRVLRELCARFRCGCGSAVEGFMLYPGAVAGKSPYVFEKGGLRLAVGGAVLSERRSLEVQPGAKVATPDGALVLSLLVDLDEPHEECEVWIERLLARDNRGEELTEQFASGPLSATFPGQRTGQVRLPLKQTQIKQLNSLQGELVLLRRGTAPPRIEMPWPTPGARVQAQINPDLALAVSRARPTTPTPAEEHPEAPAAPLSFPAFEAEQGPSLLMRAFLLPDPARPLDEGFFPPPRAVGRSGKWYFGSIGAGGGARIQERNFHFNTVSFPGATEPVEKLVWVFPAPVVREERVAFRLANIPISAVDSLPAQREWQHTEWRPMRATPTEFARAGGARLRTEVRLHGAPAPEGALYLGLAARQGVAWTPMRWCRVPVAATGNAVLEGIAPGRYQVVRHYEVAPNALSSLASGTAPAGRWQNSEVEVLVPEAGEVRLPPLELTAAPPAATPKGSLPAANPMRGEGPAAPDGLRVEPLSVRAQYGRSVHWEGMPLWPYERGEVSLSCRIFPAGAPPRDGLVFARSVSAVDDLGTVLLAQDPLAYYTSQRPQVGGGTHQFRFSAAHPRARKLVRVEGELFTYKSRRKVRIELPYPDPGKNLLARDGPNVMVAVSNDAPPPLPIGTAAEPDLLPQAGAPAERDPGVRFRLCYRDTVLEGGRTAEEQLAPAAIGASGAAYRARSGGGMSRETGDWVAHARRATYPTAKEPLVKLVWEFDVWEGPEPVGSFRLQDVPLPQRGAPPVPAGRPGAGADREAEGAALFVRVLQGKNAALGQVHFGLAERTSAGWGPVRWYEAPVDENGHARIIGLRPGRYRVTLRYTRADGTRMLGRPPSEVILTGGREWELPVLQTGAKPPP